jgi:hypothetical protein
VAKTKKRDEKKRDEAGAGTNGEMTEPVAGAA